MSDGTATTTILDAGFEDGPKGIKSLVVQQTTTPDDPNAMDARIDAADMALARYIANVLVTNYHGYDWFVETDIRQGIASFRIPELMGASLRCVINLRQHPDVPAALIKTSAGMLLERMNLPRGTVTKAQILEAKQRLHTFQFGDVGQKRV